MAIKNIIFDVGNVLAGFRYKEYMRDIGFTEYEVERMSKNIVETEIWNEVDICNKSFEEIKNDFKAVIPDMSDRIDLFFSNMTDIIERYDYSKALTDYVKDKGFGLYILSNYSDWMFEEHSNTIFDFLDRIDGKIVSGYVHMLKPDPEIYKLLLNTYNLNASECAFFDDRPVNVEGAKSVGIEAYVFTGYEDCKKKIDEILMNN